MNSEFLGVFRHPKGNFHSFSQQTWINSTMPGSTIMFNCKNVWNGSPWEIKRYPLGTMCWKKISNWARLTLGGMKSHLSIYYISMISMHIFYSCWQFCQNGCTFWWTSGLPLVNTKVEPEQYHSLSQIYPQICIHRYSLISL